MDFAQWLAANEYDEKALTEVQRRHLEAAWKAETAPPPSKEKEESGNGSSFAEKMKAIEDEDARVAFIHESVEVSAKRHIGNTEKIKQIRELGEAAVADPKMGQKDFSLAMLRLDRMLPAILPNGGRDAQVDNDVLEAAFCMNARLPNIEKHFKPMTLEIADKHFKQNGLSLHGLIDAGARRNGWRGQSVKSDLKSALRYAFRDQDEMQAGVYGPSTYTVPNILSNTANKFLKVAFEAVDMAWREFSAIASMPDFKARTSIALTGSMKFKKTGVGGEIQHGAIGEITWSNQLDQYAIMLGIDRKDVINDDLGAFNSATRRIGRGAALLLNDIFWTEFLNNSAFFTAGNNNVLTGAGSALALAGLDDADEKFRIQTDPDGEPVGLTPRILLVPPALRVTALNLMNSTLVQATTTANAPVPNSNVLAGAYRVVSSPYMQNSSFTGFSAAAWYLLADPNDMPVIETGFLNGMETPTVETAEADWNMLGIGMRGYYDVGVNLQEYRAGVRSAGS